MKNRMGSIIKIIVCFMLILPLSGCWSRHELNSLSFVVGVGLDKAEKPGEIQLTTQVVKPGELKSASAKSKSGGSGANGTNAYWNIKRTGYVASEIIRDFSHESSHRLYFPHNQVLIIEKKLAEEGIQKYIDTFIRDNETRFNVLIVVSEDRASEVLDVSPELEKLPAINIAKLVETQNVTSESPTVRLIDFINRLMSKTTAPIAPLIRVTGDGNKKTVEVFGTAVFKHDKLISELNKRETRGLLWVINKVKGGMIDAPSPTGDGTVSLEITLAKSKMTPVIQDDTILIKLDIKAEGIVNSQSGSENIESPIIFASLEKEISSEIRKEIMAALKKARDLNSDIFGFGDLIYWKYPSEWHELESKWDKVFPDVEVALNIDTKLRSTGNISAPAVPAKE
ncbi:MAG: Ger(x)C family spore germination protein [Dehalobacter sp. 4CP]|uniref:Ger(x)C family spore germination protein n=1 Tax=Dehalobacter sp. CP TaxID=2594474 RepID=UPI0013CA34E5|nr:Ger(x)C family spore germination protein [Dehalobacter sp. 4CP]